MKGRATAFVSLLVVVFAFLPTTANAATRSAGMLGPAYRKGVTPPSSQATTADNTALPGNLVYHGGRILPRSTAHAVFWTGGPAFPAGYETGVAQYFADVASDSAVQAVTNVYSVGTQYFDKRKNGTIRNHANYDVVDGGSIDISLPLANGCKVKSSRGFVRCLTDAQVQRIAKAAAGTTRGLNDIYFVFLPQGVDTCAGIFCASNFFCAYHSALLARTGWILYTNQPFADAGGGCDTGESPNADPAVDNVLSVVSHEHNETITDPLGNAWFSRSGDENGDKCNLDFGPLTGPDYNQTIGANHYYLQQEWSNRSRACLQSGT